MSGEKKHACSSTAAGIRYAIRQVWYLQADVEAAGFYDARMGHHRAAYAWGTTLLFEHRVAANADLR